MPSISLRSYESEIISSSVMMSLKIIILAVEIEVRDLVGLRERDVVEGKEKRI